MQKDLEDIKGYIHSFESFGAVDGPGIRFVVFFQGCPLRCLYCHNPDTWKPQTGEYMSVRDIIDMIKQYKNFIKNGGVTFSGGEPLFQPDFLEALLLACKAEGFHTAVDTSGAIHLKTAQKCIDACDMLLLDIKCIDSATALKLTGTGNENMIATLDYCEKIQKEVWIRQVLLDGYTLDIEKAHQTGKFLSRYTCVRKVEILPFHKMAEYKWDELNIPYALKDASEPDPKKVKEYKAILCGYGLIL